MRKKHLFSLMLAVLIMLCSTLALYSCADKCEHKFGDLNPGVAVTCNKDGLVEHKTCTLCYKNFSADGKELKSVVIKSSGMGHVFKNDSVTCEVCGAFNAVTRIEKNGNKVIIHFENGKKLDLSDNATSVKCEHTDAKEYCLEQHTQEANGLYLRECTAAGCPTPLALVSKTVHEFDTVILVDDDKNLCMDGGKEIKTCSVCQKIEETVINPAPDEGDDRVHTVAADGWVVVTHPVHTAPGQKSGVCTVCDETVLAEIPGGHDYKYVVTVSGNGNVPVDIEKRDEVKFVLTVSCKYSDCNEPSSEEIITVADLNKVSSVEPTCLEIGSDTYEYVAEDGTKSDTVSVYIGTCKHVNTWSDDDGAEQSYAFRINDKISSGDCSALAGTEGLNCKDYVETYLYCKDCEQNIKVQTIKDHTYPSVDEWKTVGQTCTEDGETTRICTECQFKDKFVAEKTGHKFEYELSASGEVPNVVLSVVAPAGCLNAGCTAGFTPVPVDKADADEKIDAPTCTKLGCAHYTYTYEGNELTADVDIEKLAHVLNGADMSENEVYVYDKVEGLKLFDDTTLKCGEASDVYFVCDSCGENVIAKARAYHAVSTAWKETLKPTCDTEGEKTGYCANCNTDNCVEKIPAKGHSFSYTYNEADATLHANCLGCDTADYTITEVAIDTEACVEATCKKGGTIVYVGKNAEGESVTVVENTPKISHTMPEGEQNPEGAYLYDENTMGLFGGEEISSGETKKALYVCPVCGTNILIKVYLP